MKPLPTDPMGLNARFISAMCEDLTDCADFKAHGFQRTEALRQILIEERRQFDESTAALIEHAVVERKKP